MWNVNKPNKTTNFFPRKISSSFSSSFSSGCSYYLFWILRRIKTEIFPSHSFPPSYRADTFRCLFVCLNCAFSVLWFYIWYSNGVQTVHTVHTVVHMFKIDVYIICFLIFYVQRSVCCFSSLHIRFMDRKTGKMAFGMNGKNMHEIVKFTMQRNEQNGNVKVAQNGEWQLMFSW